MSAIPKDIHTEPPEVDPDTLNSLGPWPSAAMLLR
jgi:hypothetical protein